MTDATGIPTHVVADPAPGTATERDAAGRDGYGCSLELVNGTLLRKFMTPEDNSRAMLLATRVGQFVWGCKLGVMGGNRTQLRLAPGLIRIPCHCYTPWAAVANEDKDADFQDAVPALVIECYGRTTTEPYLDEKLRHYAAAGVRLVWVIDPRCDVIDVYARGVGRRTLTVADTLEGGEVLPGFAMPVAELFEPFGPKLSVTGTCG